MRIMFVDDEVLLLNGFKRLLFKKKWTLYFASSGQKALEILQEHSVDFIVSDMRMPGMSGGELLERVYQLHPETVRIILSGQSDEQASIKASEFAHQWFTKPCDPQELEKTLIGIDKIRQLFPNEEILKDIGHIKTLPSPPKIFLQLKAILDNDTVDMEEISSVILKDPGLVAKLLQVTNSAFFAQTKAVETLKEAITRVGTDLVIGTILAIELYENLQNIPVDFIEIQQSHCLATAKLASSFVEQEYKDQTILVGLLHNIGKLIMLLISPKIIDVYNDKSITPEMERDYEKDKLKVEQAQLAGYLMHLWHFDYSLIKNILLHNKPNALIKMEFGPATAVYIADKLINNEDIDISLIAHFKLEEKLITWQKRADRH